MTGVISLFLVIEVVLVVLLLLVVFLLGRRPRHHNGASNVREDVQKIKEQIMDSDD